MEVGDRKLYGNRKLDGNYKGEKWLEAFGKNH
jgi:hypothetical protein